MEDVPESFFVIGKVADFKLARESADTVVERVTACLKRLVFVDYVFLHTLF